MATLACLIKYSLFSAVFLTISLISCESGKIDNRSSELQNSPQVFYSAASQFVDAALIDSTRAWVLTERDRDILLTTDSGTTWNRVQPKNAGRIDRINFIDERRGWLISKEANQGIVWKTVDGGRSWTRISRLISEDPDWGFTSAVQIKFVDDRNGWIIETFSIWHSEDSGQNWKQVFPRVGIKKEGQPSRGFFLNKLNAWICATDGEVYKTTDGGQNWKVSVIDKDVAFTDIFFVNDNVGWLSPTFSSFANHLYYTEDGGETWKRLPSFTEDVYIKSTFFLNEKEGWAVGRRLLDARANLTPSNINNKSEGILLYTSDGGRNWSSIRVGAREPFYERVKFSDNQNGWLYAQDSIYKTNDAGITWVPVLSLQQIK